MKALFRCQECGNERWVDLSDDSPTMTAPTCHGKMWLTWHFVLRADGVESARPATTDDAKQLGQ